MFYSIEPLKRYVMKTIAGGLTLTFYKVDSFAVIISKEGSFIDRYDYV